MRRKPCTRHCSTTDVSRWDTAAKCRESRWLLGFGVAVEVPGPESLRAEFADQARRLGTIYG